MKGHVFWYESSDHAEEWHARELVEAEENTVGKNFGSHMNVVGLPVTLYSVERGTEGVYLCTLEPPAQILTWYGYFVTESGAII